MQVSLPAMSMLFPSMYYKTICSFSFFRHFTYHLIWFSDIYFSEYMWLNGILKRDWFGIQACSLQWVCNFHQCTVELQCAHSDSLFYIWLDRISRYYCIDTLWCWNWGSQHSAYSRYQTTLFYSFHLQTFYILHMAWVDTTAWILCDTQIDVFDALYCRYKTMLLHVYFMEKVFNHLCMASLSR